MSANSAVLIAEFTDGVCLVNTLFCMDYPFRDDKVIYDPNMVPFFQKATPFSSLPEAKIFAQSEVKRASLEGFAVEYGTWHHKYTIDSSLVLRIDVTA